MGRTDDTTERRVVAGTTALYGMLFLDRFAPLYLVVVFRAERGLTPGQLSLLPLAIGLGWALSMALGRSLSGRMGDRNRVLLGAVGAVVLHALSVVSGSWLVFVACRFVGGVLAGSAAPAVTGLIFRWAPIARRGRDTGIVFSATRLFGSLLSPVLVLAVASRWGWRPALVVATAALAGAVVLFAVLIPRDAPLAGDRAGHRQAARPVLRVGGVRDIALSTVVGILLITWLVVISQSGPTVLVESLGITPAAASPIIGAFGVGGWLAALLVPTWSDRIGRRLAVAGAAAAGGGAGVLLVIALAGSAPPAWVAALLLAVGGVAMGGLPLALSVIPGEAVIAGDPGRAIAWPIVGAELVGAAVLPSLALLGLLPERTAIAVAAVALLGIVGLSAAFTAQEGHSPSPRR